MAYKKPKIVAKSATKQSFVAACKTEKTGWYNCHIVIK